MSAALTTTNKALLTAVKGADSGIAWELPVGNAVIGRDPECDIVLDDPRVSRRHAEVERTQLGFLVRDLDSRTGLRIDGKSCRQGVLLPGSQIEIGDTVLQFSPALEGPPAAQIPNPLSVETPQGSSNTNKPKGRVLLIGGVLLGLAAVALLTSEGSKKTAQDIRGDGAVEAEIEAVNKRREIMEIENMKSGRTTEQFREAQAAYIRCFRDYREGNFNRAIQNCNAALAIFPQHVLSAKYLRLAERRHDELIQETMFEGRKYMEQNRFDLAQSAYRKILVLIGDPANKTFQEAKARLDEIQSKLRERY